MYPFSWGKYRNARLKATYDSVRIARFRSSILLIALVEGFVQIASLSPLVRRLVELGFPLHYDEPTPTNRASARGADERIGVIKFAGSQGGVSFRSWFKILGRGQNRD